MMEKEEGFKKIKEILPYIHTYFETRAIPMSFDVEKRLLFKDVYERFVVPGSFVTLNCPPCIYSAFEVIDSFYTREYPKYEQQLNQQKQANEANTDATNPSTANTSTGNNKPVKKTRNNKKVD